MKANILKLSSAVLLASISLIACSSISQIQPSTSVQQAAEPQLKADQLKLSSSNMMSHLQAFQKIAQENAGNRAVGTAGGQASAQYIVDQPKAAGLVVNMFAFENREKTIGQNIIVEIQGQSKDTAIIVGAHYDSVKMGPGINNNASGGVLSLELMQQLKGIQGYINIDMVGTKQPNILIADADKSSLIEMENMLKQRSMDQADYKPLLDSLRILPSNAGDLGLENHLKDFFKQKKLKIKEDVSTLTASDTAAFLAKVPLTSIILFNEQMKGDVLEFAPCYHQTCDTLDQVDPQSLALAGEAVVYLLKQINTP